MIAPKILLSHEPIFGLSFCVNIHGHGHNLAFMYDDRMECYHLNLTANVCNYTPVSLGKEIKKGLHGGIPHIHKDKMIKEAREREEESQYFQYKIFRKIVFKDEKLEEFLNLLYE